MRKAQKTKICSKLKGKDRFLIMFSIFLGLRINVAEVRSNAKAFFFESIEQKSQTTSKNLFSPRSQCESDKEANFRLILSNW